MRHRKTGASPVSSMGRRDLRSSSQLIFAACLVFCSGASALVFQLAWMRELRLIFGGTTAATAAVLAIFMAGLGIGSAVLGKRADRVANPLKMYGLLEASIALSVALSPLLFSLASALYVAMGGLESLGFWGATVVRLALTTAVMALPTFLMGGTLPAAVRAVTGPNDEHRRALGVLYGSNTLGAVFGAAAATFFALENLGTRSTLWAGCALGLTTGTVAVRLAKRWRGQVADGPQAEVQADVGEVPWLIYLMAVVLGFTFFALELVWYRMLAPILGGTAFTFGLILCIALAGIGVGGIAYNVIFRRLQPSLSALAVTCGLEALLTIIPVALGDRLALLAAWRNNAASSFGDLIVGWSQVATIVVLPVALVSGVQFPLLIALLGQGRQRVSRHVGMTYAWNTLGAIAGSLVAGFGAMPLLSAPGLWQAIAAVLGLLSVGILLVSPLRGRRAAVVVLGMAILTGAALLAPGPTAAWRHSGIGAGRAHVPPPGSSPNRLRQWINEKNRTLLWQADGIECSIGIDATDGLSFIVNGKSDGNSLTDASTQMGFAILGAVLHPDPKTALVIGLGTGESAGWLAEMRGIREVDMVELEPAVDEMARRCSDLNWNVLEHPRVRRIYDDGREFVFTTDKKYDVIISEPSNPYRAGIATLYTTEFFRAARERLNPGGVFIQFLQAYEVDEATVNTVLKTVRSAFEYVEVWQTLGSDLQLVCSATPIEYSVAELHQRIGSGTVKDALALAWNVDDVEGFLGHFVANSRWADQAARDPSVPLNTDDRTLLEYSYAKTVGQETPFSVEETRDRLRAAGFHRPALRGDEVDWNQVELRRQEMNLVHGGQLSIALLPRPEDRLLVETFDRYKANDFAGTIEMWPPEHFPPTTDIQRLVLARCYAELARPECLDLVAQTETRFLTESAAVRAIYHWRAGNVAEAAKALDTFYARLVESPWVMSIIAETALSRTIDVARSDADAARRLLEHLSKPFAARRYDHLRKLARFMVAELVGAESVVAALQEMEPHVTWTAEILAPRARAYAAMNDPQAPTAERDWQWFQRHQSTSSTP